MADDGTLSPTPPVTSLPVRARLLQADPAAAEAIARTQLEVEAELADAVAFAQSSPLPEPATALDYAFTD